MLFGKYLNVLVIVKVSDPYKLGICILKGLPGPAYGRRIIV